jgi:DNA-binding MarR family transcriptional regulator
MYGTTNMEKEIQMVDNYKTNEFANTVHQLINQIAKQNQVYEDACVNFFGVTSAQGSTILAIPVDDTLKMNELSNVVGVDSSTMTRMIDQLVDKDLVKRQAGEKDRRQVHIGLTDSGCKLHQELKNALDKFYQDSLEKIPEEKREKIIESLVTVNSAIKNGLEECCNRYCQR